MSPGGMKGTQRLPSEESSLVGKTWDPNHRGAGDKARTEVHREHRGRDGPSCERVPVLLKRRHRPGVRKGGGFATSWQEEERRSSLREKHVLASPREEAGLFRPSRIERRGTDQMLRPTCVCRLAQMDKATAASQGREDRRTGGRVSSGLEAPGTIDELPRICAWGFQAP